MPALSSKENSQIGNFFLDIIYGNCYKRMRVIAKRALREFWDRFPDAEEALKTWFAEAERATWSTPGEIKAQYRSASILKDSRVVFNICGNKYRLVAKISYKNGIVLIRFVGTHREYDAINAEEV